MYEAKYSKYVTQNTTRFAECEEVIAVSSKVDKSKRNKPCGVPLFYNKHNAPYVDDGDNHTAVIGPSGCKKSRTVVFPLVSSIIEAGESAVINDPKGEIYLNTANAAYQKGSDVFVLNLRTLNGHCWNPLSVIYDYYYSGDEDTAFALTNDFVECIVNPSIEKTVDRYWGDSSKYMLNGDTLSLLDSVNDKRYFNISNVIQFCNEGNVNKLKIIHKCMDPNSIAALCYNSSLNLQAEKTRSCIFSTLQACLEPFIKNPKLTKMLSASSFDMENLGKKQTIIYIIYPDEKTTYNFIVNMFLTQAYEILVRLASASANDRLPVRVNFVLDEFANLPKIDNFENRISEARSKNIRYILCLQSFNQLESKYGKNAETIISNCNNWICFSSKEMSFLNKIAEICGKEVDYNGTEHYLLTPSEMQQLKKEEEYAEALVIKQGLYPFVTELADFDYIPQFKTSKAKMPERFKNAEYGKLISFNEWFSFVETDVFRSPFKKIKTRSEKQDLDKELEAKLDELFGNAS